MLRLILVHRTLEEVVVVTAATAGLDLGGFEQVAVGLGNLKLGKPLHGTCARVLLGGLMGSRVDIRAESPAFARGCLI